MFEEQEQVAAGFSPRQLRGASKQSGSGGKREDYQSVEIMETRRETALETTALALDTEDTLTADEMSAVVYAEPPHLTCWKPGYFVIGKGRNLSHTAMILAFMFGVWAAGTKFIPETAWFYKLFHPVALTTILMAFGIVFRDPGFIQRKSMVRSEFEGYRKERRLKCRKCLTIDTDNARHCNYCNCCVLGLDHHCDVFGNCIAKNNLYFFWGTIALGIITLAYVYVNVTMYINTILDTGVKTPQIPPKA